MTMHQSARRAWPVLLCLAGVGVLIGVTQPALAWASAEPAPAETSQRVDLIEAAGLQSELLGTVLDAVINQLGKPGIDLNVTITTQAGEPYANQTVRVLAGGETTERTTDAAGTLIVLVTPENHAGLALIAPARCAVRVVSTVQVKVGAPGEFGAPGGAIRSMYTFRPGDTVPAIKPEVLIGAPEGLSLAWADLKGRLVVLEFWATWCAPCVAAIPHMNDLADRFKERGVVFLSVTDEGEGVIRPFLKTHPMKGVVALDTDRSILKDFGVRSWPQTYLIRDGKVLAVMHPSQLTAARLEATLARRPLDSADPPTQD